MIWQGKDYEVVHASLNQPEQWGYVLEPAVTAQHFVHQTKPRCFIGHSYQPKMFVEDPTNLCMEKEYQMT